MLDSTLHPEYIKANYVLRDYLAADRTIMANERTLLAYLRSSFTSFVLGASFIKFFPESVVISTLGWMAVPFGFILGVFGLFRYKQMKRLILEAEKQVPQT